MHRLTHISIKEWCDIIDMHNTFTPRIIMEIGSMDGADADEIAKRYNVEEVHIVEAHKEFAANIRAYYPDYNIYPVAASNVTEDGLFHAVISSSNNKGVSSLLERDELLFPSYETDGFEPQEVNVMRMDCLCDAAGIEEIDMLKIDVEGLTYEVLTGFGELLWFVKSLHIEAEHTQVWKNQKLYSDIEAYLLAMGFIPVSIRMGFPQSDSCWIKKEFYNPNWFDNE